MTRIPVLPNDPTITPLNLFPLPVSLMDIKAALKGAAIEVAWNVASETGMVKYEIEKSSNGRSFTKIGEVAALNRSSVTPYSFFDQAPFTGSNYYRLRLIDGVLQRSIVPLLGLTWTEKITR